MFSDAFASGVAEHGFRSTVPGEDYPAEAVGNDGILGVFYDRRQQPLRFLARPPLGHVLFDGDVSGDFAAGGPNGSDAHLLGIKSAVFAPVDRLAVPDLS